MATINRQYTTEASGAEPYTRRACVVSVGMFTSQVDLFHLYHGGKIYGEVQRYTLLTVYCL